jgi:hypothetical protein
MMPFTLDQLTLGILILTIPIAIDSTWSLAERIYHLTKQQSTE